MSDAARAIENPSYTRARERAAQIWCEPQHSHKEMDVEFAESIAKAIFEAAVCSAAIRAQAEFQGQEMNKLIVREQQQTAALRIALLKYAEHLGDCGMYDGNIARCTCGYDALLADAGPHAEEWRALNEMFAFMQRTYGGNGSTESKLVAAVERARQR